MMTIWYNSSVHTQAGYRSVKITASAEKISAKRCKVLEVIAIDGQQVTANMSRTGAKRQQFYGTGVARREANRIKNLSACTVLTNEVKG